jgi:hypothetical protein
MRTCIVHLLLCLLGTPIQAVAGSGAVHVVQGEARKYYHVRFDLTPENCELSVPLTERMPRYSDSNTYEFTSWGQFEVFVRRTAFPVPAPHTNREFLILRMPATDPGSHPKGKRLLARKRDLFDAILRMKTENAGRVEVIVELNPFMRVVSHDPLRVELTGRNIFFRQAYGQYIDYMGPLRSEDRHIDISPSPDGPAGVRE